MSEFNADNVTSYFSQLSAGYDDWRRQLAAIPDFNNPREPTPFEDAPSIKEIVQTPRRIDGNYTVDIEQNPKLHTSHYHMFKGNHGEIPAVESVTVPWSLEQARAFLSDAEWNSVSTSGRTVNKNQTNYEKLMDAGKIGGETVIRLDEDFFNRAIMQAASNVGSTNKFTLSVMLRFEVEYIDERSGNVRAKDYVIRGDHVISPSAGRTAAQEIFRRLDRQFQDRLRAAPHYHSRAGNAYATELKFTVFENKRIGSKVGMCKALQEFFYNPDSRDTCVMDCMKYCGIDLTPEQQAGLLTKLGGQITTKNIKKFLNEVFKLMPNDAKVGFKLYVPESSGKVRINCPSYIGCTEKWHVLLVVHAHMMVVLDPSCLDRIDRDSFVLGDYSDITIEQRIRNAKFAPLKTRRRLLEPVKKFKMPDNVYFWDLETANDNNKNHHVIAACFFQLNQIYRHVDQETVFTELDPPGYYINHIDDIKPKEMGIYKGNPLSDNCRHMIKAEGDNTHSNIWYGTDAGEKFTLWCKNMMDKILSKVERQAWAEINKLDGLTEDMKKEQVKKRITVLKRFNKVSLYAHNGGRYDLYVLLKSKNYLVDHITEAIDSGGYIYICLGGVLEFKDTVRHLANSLGELCTSYKVPEYLAKGDMPYGFYKHPRSTKIDSVVLRDTLSDEEKLYLLEKMVGKRDDLERDLRGSLYYCGPLELTRGHWKVDPPQFPEELGFSAPPTPDWLSKSVEEKQAFVTDPDHKLMFGVYADMVKEGYLYKTTTWRETLANRCCAINKDKYQSFRVLAGESYIDPDTMTDDQYKVYEEWCGRMKSWCEKTLVDYDMAVSGVFDARAHCLRYMINDVIALGIVYTRYAWNKFKCNGDYAFDSLTLPGYAYKNVMADINFDLSKLGELLEVLKEDMTKPENRRKAKETYERCCYPDDLKIMVCKDFFVDAHTRYAGFGGRVNLGENHYEHEWYDWFVRREKRLKYLNSLKPEAAAKRDTEITAGKEKVAKCFAEKAELESILKALNEDRDGTVIARQEIEAKLEKLALDIEDAIIDTKNADELREEIVKRMNQVDLTVEEALKGLHKSCQDFMVAVDGSSLYPSAMYIGYYPTGKMYVVDPALHENYMNCLNKGLRHIKLFMITCDLTYTDRNVAFPIVPTKTDAGQTIYDVYDKTNRTFGCIDLYDFIKYNNVKVTKVHRIIEWPGQRQIFRDKIKELYMRRMDFKRAGDKISADNTKLEMNATFGQNLMKIINTKMQFLDYEEACKAQNEGKLRSYIELWGTYTPESMGGKIVTETVLTEENATDTELASLINRAPEIGSFILQNSRMIMNAYIDSFDGFGANPPYYTDTDSVYIMQSTYLKSIWEPIPEGQLEALIAKRDAEKSLPPWERTVKISPCGKYRYKVNPWGMTWATVSDDANDSFMTQFHDDTDDKVRDPKIIKAHFLEPKVKSVEYLCFKSDKIETVMEDTNFSNVMQKVKEKYDDFKVVIPEGTDDRVKVAGRNVANFSADRYKALAGLESDAIGDVIIRDEANNQYMRMPVDDYVAEFTKGTHLHEIVPENRTQRVRFDIDAKVEESVWPLVQAIVDEVNQVMIDNNEEPRESLITSSSSKGKQSYHILTPIYAENCHAANAIAQDIHHKLRSHPMEQFIDKKVHKVNQSFRMVYCSKADDITRIKTPLEFTGRLEDYLIGWYWDSQPPVMLYPSVAAPVYETPVICPEVLSLVPDADCWQFRGLEGGVYSFNRLKPSHCQICNEVHHKDNSMFLVASRGGVWMRCRQKDGAVLLSKVALPVTEKQVEKEKKLQTTLKLTVMRDNIPQLSKTVVTKGPEYPALSFKTTFKGFKAKEDKMAAGLKGKGKITGAYTRPTDGELPEEIKVAGLSEVLEPALYETLRLNDVSVKMVYSQFKRGANAGVTTVDSHKVIRAHDWTGRYWHEKSPGNYKLLPWGHPDIPAYLNHEKLLELKKGNNKYD